MEVFLPRVAACTGHSTFSIVSCVCGAKLGRVYVTTTTEHDDLREMITFDITAITRCVWLTFSVCLGVPRNSHYVRVVTSSVVRL